MPAAARSAGSPMPDSCSSLGEPKAPAETITSRLALYVRTLPPSIAWMPTARPLLMITLETVTLARTVRLGRLRAGRR